MTASGRRCMTIAVTVGRWCNALFML